MVSRVSAALTSSVFQTDAFTGLAFWTANRATRAVSQAHDPEKCEAVFPRQTQMRLLGDQCANKKMARTSGIEPLSMRGQRMALPIYQVRSLDGNSADGWWVTAELNRACAKAQALQARSVTRLGVTPNVLNKLATETEACLPAGRVGHHDRTRTYIPDLRTVVLIQLSYVVMTAGRGRRLTFRVRHPSTGSRARSRAGSSAGSAAAPR